MCEYSSVCLVLPTNISLDINLDESALVSCIVMMLVSDWCDCYLHCAGCLQWVVQGPVDVDIGANPSAEGGEDEGVDDTAVKVVDIVDTFRLQVAALQCVRSYFLS